MLTHPGKDEHSRLPGPHCNVNMECSTSNVDFEVLCVDVTKTGHKYISIICIYRPPRFLEKAFTNCKSEI